MNNKFYLTTTTPYVNAIPHIGHALEFIQGDVITRYKRQKLGAENVWFNLGTDENGLKVFQKSQAEGLPPKEYADKYASKWKEFCELFSIKYDSFYRTSEPYHIKPVQEFWKLSEKSGDIYKKKYEGLYCVGCESFKTEKELVDGKCPDHGVPPIKYSEENYFFKLSKYKDVLLQWLDANPDILKPIHKFEELKAWISNMEDISISRLKKNLPWGVDVPGDPTQVVYVWFDALTNYINAIGFANDEEKLHTWWPGVQIFGPDNLRFQGAIWQGMLASVGLPHTNKLLCHGTIMGPDGRKMSKTIGNVISPFDQEEKFGAEVVRFYLISSISTYGDSAYKEEDLINAYNSHLANNYGNLLNRVIHLSNKLEVTINDKEKVESNFKSQVDELKNKVNAFYDDYELQLAAETINELANFGNKYIDENKPWNKEVTHEDAEKVLNNLSYLISTVTELYEPIIPESAKKAKDMLSKREIGILFEKIQ